MRPQLESGNNRAPSAAREALQSNLDSTLTLNRKKSWFGSARDAMQRSAKGVVGHLKNSDRKSSYGEDQENLDPERADEDGGINRRQQSAGGDDDSLTPLRTTPAHRQKTFTPKTAMNSLRQHMHASGVDKGKRGALSDITGGGVNEMRGPTGPELFSIDDLDPADGARPPEKSPTKRHGRPSSVAKSVIGSLRSLSRRSTMSKPTSPISDSGSPTKRAMAIPLPSSPVDVPAPTLKLNLGDTANMSTSFLNRSPNFVQDAELMAVTDPAAHQPLKVPTYYTRLPGEGPSDTLLPSNRVGKPRPLPAGVLLELPVDDFGFSPPEGPTTPMPGTNAQMDLDRTMEVFHEPPLFERSVEARDTPEKRDNKTLKKMISINALAEQHIKDSPRCGIRLTPVSARKTRNISNTTVQTCPSDMPPLTRQLAALSTTIGGRRDPAVRAWKSDDPFAPGTPIGGMASDWPTASTKEVALPERPKITLQTAISIDAKSDTGAPPSEHASSQTHTASSESTKLCGNDMLLGQVQARIIAARAVADHPSGLDPIRFAQVLSVPESLKLLQESTREPKSQTSSRLSSAQYDQFHPEHFLGLQECERGDPPPSRAGSEEERSVMETQDLENAAPSSKVAMLETPNQTRHSTRADILSDTSDVFWKLSVQDWMQKGGDSCTPSLGPSPRQGSFAASLDSVSEQRVISPISPIVMSPERSPTMGDRLSFDLRRSNRNMRYNTLTDMSNESTAEQELAATGPTAALPSPAHRYATLQSEHHDIQLGCELSVPNSEAVFRPSARSSPLKRLSRQRITEYDASSDNMESELKNAITDHYVFQSALAGVGVTVWPTTGDVNATSVQAIALLPAFGEAMPSADMGSSDVLEFPESQTNGHVRVDSSQVVDDSQMRHAYGSITEESSDESEGGGSPNEFRFTAPADVGPDADSLDDCLDLYKSYEACQGRFPGDNTSLEIDYVQAVRRSLSTDIHGGDTGDILNSTAVPESSRPSKRPESSMSPPSAPTPTSPKPGSAGRKTPARCRSLKIKRSALDSPYGHEF